MYPNGTLHLEGLKRHFLRQNDSAYSYEGVSQLRGVDTESWITFLDREVFNNQTVLTDGYVQVYYTRPNWSVATSYNSYFNMSVPWVYVVVGNYTYPSDNGTWVTYSDTNVFNVLEFQTVEPNYDVFDVSICFGVDQHSFLSLTLPLPAGVRFTSIDHTLLKSKVRMALSQAVNIPASRIGGIYVSIICVRTYYTVDEFLAGTLNALMVTNRRGNITELKVLFTIKNIHSLGVLNFILKPSKAIVIKKLV